MQGQATSLATKAREAALVEQYLTTKGYERALQAFRE